MKSNCNIMYQYQLSLVVFSLVMLLFLMLASMMEMDESDASYEYHQYITDMVSNVSRSNSSNDCIIPSFDLVLRDMKYRQLFTKKMHAPCQNLQPNLTFFINDTLKWNKTELDKAPPILCFANFIARKANNDDVILHSEKFKIVIGIDRKLGGSLIHVICHKVNKANGQYTEVYYRNIHVNFYNIKISKNKPDSQQSPPQSPPKSVLMILLESLSRVNAHVQLPKTVDVLKTVYNATILSGMMKVGDNTFPNVVAMLTGLYAGDRNGSNSEIGHDFNALPFLWKIYNSHPQCLTMYSEVCMREVS